MRLVRQHIVAICRTLQALCGTRTHGPPYHRSLDGVTRASAGLVDHESRATRAKRPKTIDRACPLAPALVFPQCSLASVPDLTTGRLSWSCQGGRGSFEAACDPGGRDVLQVHRVVRPYSPIGVEGRTSSPRPPTHLFALLHGPLRARSCRGRRPTPGAFRANHDPGKQDTMTTATAQPATAAARGAAGAGRRVRNHFETSAHEVLVRRGLRAVGAHVFGVVTRRPERWATRAVRPLTYGVPQLLPLPSGSG
jgi:hypothetical protein